MFLWTCFLFSCLGKNVRKRGGGGKDRKHNKERIPTFGFAHFAKKKKKIFITFLPHIYEINIFIPKTQVNIKQP